MTDNVRISVAMATFNGAKHLEAQLNSLTLQHSLPFELIVGDDGSTDSTLQVLNEFKNSAPFTVKILENKSNLGYAKNFLNVAKNCRGDWIAFCDQDDIWLPGRLAELKKIIENNEKINMVLQRAELCGSALGGTNISFPPRRWKGYYGRNELPGFWVWPGFLMTARSELLKDIDYNHRPKSYFSPDGDQPHDKWLCMIGNSLGGIFVSESRMALYRRHENALTGSYERKSVARRAKQISSTGHERYYFLGRVAMSCCIVLKNMSEQKILSNYSKDFQTSSMLYRRLCRIYLLRGMLYDRKKTISRIYIVSEIFRRGGYRNNGFTAIGRRALFKDLLRLFF